MMELVKILLSCMLLVQQGDGQSPGIPPNTRPNNGKQI